MKQRLIVIHPRVLSPVDLKTRSKASVSYASAQLTLDELDEFVKELQEAVKTARRLNEEYVHEAYKYAIRAKHEPRRYIGLRNTIVGTPFYYEVSTDPFDAATWDDRQHADDVRTGKGPGIIQETDSKLLTSDDYEVVRLDIVTSVTK